MFGEKFTDAEVSILRYKLLRRIPDPLELADILMDFVVSQGYGVSSSMALDCAMKNRSIGLLVRHHTGSTRVGRIGNVEISLINRTISDRSAIFQPQRLSLPLIPTCA